MENDALQRRRTMLPKWRTFGASLEVFSKDANKEVPRLQTHGWAVDETLVDRFASNPNPSLAMELRHSAELVGDDEVLKLVAPYLNDFQFRWQPHRTETPIDDSERQQDHQRAVEYGIPYSALADIERHKRLLKTSPDDAIAWIDLGLLYLQLGSFKNADRCCKISCHLAPENPFIIRSATRCFAHIGKIDYALEIYRKCRRLDHDPWLLAAQISACEIAGVHQRKIGSARNLIASGKFSDFALSELRAALGTIEERTGSHVKAKKIFRSALADPTENTVSQVIKMGHQSIIPDRIIDHPPPRSFEAMARIAFRNGEWDSALSASQAWLADEQYSGRPAILSSFILQIGRGDHQNALKILDAGIRSNPEDITLKNNRVFSLACSGETTGAKALLHEIKLNESAKEHPFLDATEGLIHYREGNVEMGREFYARSIERFLECNNRNSARLAAIYQAAEELRANVLEATTHADYVIDAIGDVTEPGMLLALQRLKRIREEVSTSGTPPAP